MQSFFKRGNLLALREMALRVAAQHAGTDVHEYRQAHEIEATWPSAERILVCVGPAPASARIVRAASRMASGLHAPWTAVYVESDHLASHSKADHLRLESHLELAESLGADVVRLGGGRISQAILEYARQHSVTRIILGKPTHSRLRDVWRGSLLDEIVRGSQDIDVHIIAGEAETAGAEARESTAPPVRRSNFIWVAVLVGLVTIAAVPAREFLAAPDFVMLYLLVIMVVAIRFGRAASVLASALSVLAYDFFFVPPYYSFSVHDQRNVLTFLMMFVVGLLISGLTLRIRRQEHEARGREARTAALYTLSRDLGSALDEEQVAAVAAQQAAQVFESGVAILLPDAGGGLGLRAKGGHDMQFETQELGVARWVFEHGRPAGRGTDTLAGARVMCVPLRSGQETLGVLALAFEKGEPDSADQRHFLDTFGRQVALALERSRLAEQAKSAALRARSEEMRSSLLSAVSHDLRTPLAAITGAATELRDGGPAATAAQRGDLIETICEEAERLERLLSNLLDMTRVESGALQIKREWVPLEEIVGSALTRLEVPLAGRPIEVDLRADLPLLSADPVLLEQVFVNLLENAAKYTPSGSPIAIGAGTRGDAIEIEVADRGPGIPSGHESQIFEKFSRGEHAGIHGVGLGLAICRGIVQAHGGTLTAANRDDGGAVFRITLPIPSAPPVMPSTLDEQPPSEVAP
jgi:two-component system sensor histidine kinase KdpD